MKKLIEYFTFFFLSHCHQKPRIYFLILVYLKLDQSYLRNSITHIVKFQSVEKRTYTNSPLHLDALGKIVMQQQTQGYLIPAIGNSTILI
jgi:hypothetical protein